MFKIVFFILFFCISVFLQGDDSSVKQKQIESIDQQINTLEKERDRYQKMADFHGKRGCSLQFNKEFSLESRREYFLAEKDLDKIYLADLKIRGLQAQKQELLEE